MRLQSRPWYCGAAAVVNALRCYGVRVREQVVAKHGGVSKEHGIQEHGIKQSLERLGYGWEEISERRYANAEGLLLAALRRGHAVIVLVEEGGHWVVATGLLGDRVTVFDSQTGAWNRRENGVHVLQAGAQLRRYWTACGGQRYGIVVKPA